MTVTVLDIDPATSPVSLAMTRPDSSELAHNGQFTAGHFGINNLGVAYCDTSGATPGEVATLGFDGSTQRWFLHSGTVASEPHLMMLRHTSRQTIPIATPPVEHAQRTSARSRQTIPRPNVPAGHAEREAARALLSPRPLRDDAIGHPARYGGQ